MKYLLVIFFFLLSWNYADSQAFITLDQASKKTQKCFNEAFKQSKSGQYENAIKSLKKIRNQQPPCIDVLMLEASIYGATKNYAKAEFLFEKGIALAPEYMPRMYYELALAELKQEKYAEAIEHFEAYIPLETKSEKRKKKAEQHIKNASQLATIKAKPVPFEVHNLGENINTKESEYLPSLSADGKILVYTARRNQQEDFYFATKEGDNWTQGRPMQNINTPHNEGAQCLSPDGKLLIFTRCDNYGFGDCDLYFSEYKNGQWTKDQKMPSYINSDAWDGQPSLSADGKYLYFSSERAGGLGGRDIWRSTKNKKGQWGIPQNLGRPINTRGQEESPFIHADGETLYFCSDEHPGLGKADLFISKLVDGQWGTPKNLGYPINTKANEGTLFVSTDGKTAYFATDRYDSLSSKPNYDIFSFKLYEEVRPKPVSYVKGWVHHIKSKRPLKANISIQSLDGLYQTSTSTSDNGRFVICLPSGKDYSLHVEKDGYIFYSDYFSLTKAKAFKEAFALDIPLTPIENTISSTQESTIRLNNIFFKSGQYQLLPTSEVEIQKLYHLLDSQPSLRIQIEGHTDNIGSDEDNLLLSENRAKAVYERLIELGIQAERLSYKGYGESNPIADNETEIGRQKNRRTEVRFIH